MFESNDSESFCSSGDLNIIRNDLLGLLNDAKKRNCRHSLDSILKQYGHLLPSEYYANNLKEIESNRQWDLRHIFYNHWIKHHCGDAVIDCSKFDKMKFLQELWIWLPAPNIPCNKFDVKYPDHSEIQSALKKEMVDWLNGKFMHFLGNPLNNRWDSVYTLPFDCEPGKEIGDFKHFCTQFAEKYGSLLTISESTSIKSQTKCEIAQSFWRNPIDTYAPTVYQFKQNESTFAPYPDAASRGSKRAKQRDVKEIKNMQPLQDQDERLYWHLTRIDDELIERAKPHYQYHCYFLNRISFLDRTLDRVNGGSHDIRIKKKEQLYVDQNPDELEFYLQPISETSPWNKQSLNIFLQICKVYMKNFRITEELIDEWFPDHWQSTNLSEIPENHLVKDLLLQWFAQYPENQSIDMTVTPIKELLFNLCHYDMKSLVTMYLIRERNRLIEISESNKRKCISLIKASAYDARNKTISNGW